MTLGELKAQFKSLLNNTVVNANDALVSTFINQGIMRIQRELRTPFMEKQALFTVPSDFTKLAIPSDFLALKALLVDVDGDGINEYELTRRDLSTVVKASQTPGHPTLYARQGGSWVIGNLPREGDNILIYYYAEFPELTSDTATNAATVVAWDAVLYGALSFAADYLGDERFDRFEGRYTQVTKSLQEQADADELTADAVVGPALQYEDESW